MPIPTFGSKLENLTYKKRKGAYAVVFENHSRMRLGLIRVNHNYFLLGGGMEEGETDEQCLRREILEEVGYTFKNIRYIGHALQYLISRDGRPLMNDGYFYAVSLMEKVQQPVETDHFFEWVNSDRSLETLMVREQQAWAIQQALITEHI
ncbi:NUDIX domain-containing protein [Sporolactobacillus laevolacticus]|uniref:NTP pyrophosphohydrolase n=1 Tax=Sporolactobacillus laevolacticus DSM 442 TaxID=1395513 RepID=V6J959_9BACL|nr:NUDIX domain-containing protein [Sporolactobacillus laevolacticus]EST13319.1 NTP pyrophosphohydrolase [Sporolactobacillus laevolacticus DSM 442]